MGAWKYMYKVKILRNWSQYVDIRLGGQRADGREEMK